MNPPFSSREVPLTSGGNWPGRLAGGPAPFFLLRHSGAFIARPGRGCNHGKGQFTKRFQCVARLLSYSINSDRRLSWVTDCMTETAGCMPRHA